MSKYKASAPSRANTASSIRGKISAPIPIPDDEEFPIRSPGTGIATPLGNEGIDKQLRSPIGIHQTGIAVSDFSEIRASSTQRSYAEQPRHVLPTTLRNSQTSQPTEGSSIEKPQRKKTTLKSVLGRLFGTKKGKAGASRSSTQNTNRARLDQHRSDPSALNRDKPASTSQNRTVSLPINEYNRALRSHSPFTESFPLQNPSENRTSTLAERRARTRRATTPSRLFDPTSTDPVNNCGLAPRPVSSHANSRVFTDDGERTGIGFAVTSGSHPHRRSRSLDGLKQAMEAQAQSNTRRRSDDIRYWRQSYDVDALSPMSSPRPEQESQSLEQHEEHPAEEVEQADENVAPKPFNFGPMGEMAGMKITEAASLEQRVNKMEEKVHQMEKMIYQMRDLSAGPGANKQVSQKGGRSSSGKRPADQSSEYSLPRHVDRLRAKEPEQRTSSSYSRPSTKDTQNSTIGSSYSRPLSTSTTIRGIQSSSPPLPIDKDANQLSGERYNKLVSFVTNEQQARLRLETIVERLQTQLEEQIRVQARPTSLLTHHPNTQLLQYSHGSGPDPYPTPSPEHGSVQRSQRVTQSAFEADDSSDEEEEEEEEEEENPNDVFQTPREEASNYDMNPEYEIEEDDERDGKHAVRHTSLSQLTLGKGRGGLHAVNF